MPRRFTSDIKILQNNPQFAKGVSDMANAFVVKEQMTAKKNDMDIRNFENLINVSSKGISQMDQAEITKDITGFRSDAVKRGLAADGKLGLKDLNDLKLSREAIEAKVELSATQKKELAEVMKYTFQHQDDIDMPAMQEGMAAWQGQSIADRPSPWSLVKTKDEFNVTEYLNKTLSKNVKKDGSKFAGGYERTEKYSPVLEMQGFYANNPDYKRQIDLEFAKATQTEEGKAQFTTPEDYMIKTYGPRHTVDNKVPTWYKPTADPKTKTPTALKKNKMGGWQFPEAMSLQQGQGTYYTFDGQSHEFEAEGLRNSKVVAVVPHKFEGQNEQLYAVVQVPKTSSTENGPTDTTGMSEGAKGAAMMGDLLQKYLPSSSKVDQEKVTQVLVPYDDIKEVLGTSYKFEGIEDYSSSNFDQSIDPN